MESIPNFKADLNYTMQMQNLEYPGIVIASSGLGCVRTDMGLEQRISEYRTVLRCNGYACILELEGKGSWVTGLEVSENENTSRIFNSNETPDLKYISMIKFNIFNLKIFMHFLMSLCR